MRSRLPLLLGLIAASTQASAEACDWIEVGYWQLDRTPMSYGRLAGDTQRHRPVLSWLLCGQPDADAQDNRRHWRFEGAQLGNRQHDWQVQAGDYGRWRASIGQRQLASARSEIRSPFVNIGSDHLQLPADWLAAASSAGMTRLPSRLQDARLGNSRRITQIGARWQCPGHWQAELRYREDARHGLGNIAGVIGTSGGNARAIALPMPIDTRTRELEAHIGRSDTRWQWQGRLLLSQFNNGIDRLSWQDPFANVAGWYPASSYPSEAQLQPAPDNRWLQLGFALATSLGDHARFSADLGLGRATQNQLYLPYSAIPALQATVTQPLPRASFDGRIESTQLLLRLHSQASTPWRWHFDYRLDERDNRSPVDEYVLIAGDAQAQNTAPDSATRRYNHVGDYRDQRLQAEAGYRPSRRFDASLGLGRQQVDRSGSARSDNDEQHWKLQLRSRPHNTVGLALRWQESRRRGGSYVGSRPFIESHAPGYTDTVPAGFENLPGLRQFHLADRDRRQLALQLDYEARPGLSLGARIGSTRDDYRASEFGLQHSHLHDWQLEAVYAVSGWSLAAYTGFERARIAQDGRAFQGGANRLPQANDPNRDWRAEHDDRIRTHGLSLRRDITQRGSLSLDYAQSQVRGQVDMTVGTALTAAPLPETQADLRSLELRGEWALRERIDLYVAWRWERFAAADWAIDGVVVNTLANVILLGEESPDYNAGAWTVGVRWGF